MTAVLTFDGARQTAFAMLSGDHNPLHVDLDQARRSQFGGCVVHGVHLIMAALDALDLAGPHRITKLEAQFRAAIMVGEIASFTPESLGPGRIRILITVEGRLRMTVQVVLESISDIGMLSQRTEWPMDVTVRPDFDNMADCKGIEPLALDAPALARLFPSLSRTLLRADTGVLLATTRVVGMQCPGQWALFRQFQWEQQRDLDGPKEGMSFEVLSLDRRFSMVSLGFTAGRRALRAEVLLRQPPPNQVDFGRVRALVPEGLFSGTRGVVVGGSRGLGEVAAKILAAGGAEVLVTYRSGRQDANRVVAELGAGAQALRFEAEDPSTDSLAQIVAFRPSHLAYFATPIIAKRPPGSWDSATFDRFTAVYSTGLSKLFGAVQATRSLESVFFPSTTFVEERPSGFFEYIAAKEAGEALCATWQHAFPSLRCRWDRLPPLVTDQTAARMNDDPIRNLEVLLPMLRGAILG